MLNLVTTGKNLWENYKISRRAEEIDERDRFLAEYAGRVLVSQALPLSKDEKRALMTNSLESRFPNVSVPRIERLVSVLLS